MVLWPIIAIETMCGLIGDLLKRGDISANVGVRPGDIIIVPQSWF